MDLNALRKIGYGMYLIGAYQGERRNAQVANTVFQISSEPPTLAVSINKDNLTHEFIKSSRVFSASVLTESTPLPFIGTFGFNSGRQIDKLKGVNYKFGRTGAPVILENANACYEAEVIQDIDVGTHTIFIGRVVAAEILSDAPGMTYDYYHKVKRGVTPKSAPSYIAKEKEAMVNMDKYECTVCGYIYDPALGDHDASILPGTPFDKLPDTWVCPVCGAGKSEFKKLGT
jgi:flavin reductase (DIM6/NTAB) family NADH-FMN oxidoreductase RutF/rubredoxin